MSPTPGDFEELLGRLTLEEKVRILTGQDFWSTHPLPGIGLRSMVLSDGPSGVRGAVWDERDPSLNLPSATALASSWDVGIAHQYGVVSGLEARRKGVDVVLGPTINLHRSPLGGRHFEAFSEDPVLTSELAAAYVSGVQELGVGATPKHYIANDFETERFTADVVVSERALRELYLLAFEKAVTEAKAWLVMSSYNSINGATASENELLETPLNTDWGFDGVVVSDWTAVRSLESAKHSQDLAMPGPVGAWGDALVEAVRSGEIKEDAIDRKVLRIIALGARVGALEGFEKPASVPDVDGVAFARTAAAEGSVLVRNTGELPWDASALSRVAIIGHNAQHARTQGGGSATVIPSSVVSPLDGLRTALPGVDVTYSVGAVVQEGIAELPLESMVNPSTGKHGARVRFLDANGVELFAEDRFSSALVYIGGGAPIGQTSTFEFRTTYTPSESGTILLGFASVGLGRIFVDGTLAREVTAVPEGKDLAEIMLAPPSVSTPVEVTAGQSIDVRVELELEKHEGAFADAMAITVGVEPDRSNPQALIDEAVAAARAAEVAVVVVGTNSKVESEGYDRTTLALPGLQDDLVRAVALVNPRTVVVVNAGSPVLMPWRDEVAAVLVTYFGGQEYGNALADVLLGVVEPGGRLPTTWAREESDVPVIDVTPRNGIVRYDEGIHIGYRAWLRAGTEPAYEFGHGLGYTTWSLSDLAASQSAVSVNVTNTGERSGKHVIQVYAERPETTVDRPVRWLAGFTVVRLDAGESTEATIDLQPHTFQHWDNGWTTEPGTFTLHAGSSVTNLPLSTTIQVD
ncbi:glycoside hydrolase family 3 protein [Kribbella antiqua]|nr:glycoside hydrolase family 3 C-terminal domain-containing protein [Kribbella antiqua]